MANILVADDEKHITRLIQVNLERAGHKVKKVADGTEVLEAIVEEKPDLLVLDWMMPRLNGLETMKRLKANPVTADIPIIMLTAKAEDADVFKGWSGGCDCYLTKPFNPMELLTFVNRILEPIDDEDENVYVL